MSGSEKLTTVGSLTPNNPYHAADRHFSACIRANIQSRLLASSLTISPLPLETSPSEPHIPIYTSTNISHCKRLILYIGESWQDLGVLAWRVIGQTSIAAGSIIDFVHTIQQAPDNPGILIANTGQLLWYRGGQRAITMTTWQALPRQTAMGLAMEIHETRNRVPGHRDPKEHIANIFEEVIPKLARGDVVIDVAATGDGASDVVVYLRNNWEGKCEKNVQAVAVGAGYVWDAEHVIGGGPFRLFWGDVSFASLIIGFHSVSLMTVTDGHGPTSTARSSIHPILRAPGYAVGGSQRNGLQLLFSGRKRGSRTRYPGGV